MTQEELSVGRKVERPVSRRYVQKEKRKANLKAKVTALREHKTPAHAIKEYVKKTENSNEVERPDSKKGVKKEKRMTNLKAKVTAIRKDKVERPDSKKKEKRMTNLKAKVTALREDKAAAHVIINEYVEKAENSNEVVATTYGGGCSPFSRKKRTANKIVKVSALREYQDQVKENCVKRLRNANNAVEGEPPPKKKKNSGTPQELNLIEKVKMQEKESEAEGEPPPKKMKQKMTPQELEERFSKGKQPKLPSLKLYVPVGGKASLELRPSERQPLLFSHVQHLILRSQLGRMMPGRKDHYWISIKQLDKIKKRIVVIVEGISLEDYSQLEANLSCLPGFCIKVQFISPNSYGGDLIQELVSVPITNSQIKRYCSRFGTLTEVMRVRQGEVYKALKPIFGLGSSAPESRKRKPSSDKFPRTQLLLSPWQMVTESYPVPGTSEYSKKFVDFVPTRDSYAEVTPYSPMWAIDCEMCRTREGSELTRITIVDENLEIIYESFVKPYNRIIDYVTQFSGITKEKLEGVWTRLEDVQAWVQKSCPPDVILIGQSLGGDLKAMKMTHPYVIDTSVIFNLSGERYRKSKLKYLAAEFLSETIQNKGMEGHDSAEDAITAMKLVLLKLQHSLEWGDAVMSGPRDPRESEAARALLLEREKNENHGTTLQMVDHQQEFFSSLFTSLIRYNKKVEVVVRREVSQDYVGLIPAGLKRTVVSEVRTNKEALKVATKADADLALVHLRFKKDRALSALLKLDKWMKRLIEKVDNYSFLSVALCGAAGGEGGSTGGLCCARVKVPPVETLPRIPYKKPIPTNQSPLKNCTELQK